MTSRFGAAGAFVKRVIARILRFITLPLEERIADADRRTEAAVAQVSAIEARSDAAGIAARNDAAGIAALRIFADALARDVLALRSRLSVIEVTLNDTAVRADVAAVERGMMLRLNADCDAASAHRSFVEREVGRVEGEIGRMAGMTLRIDSLAAVVSELSAVLEATASFCAVAGTLGVFQLAEGAEGPVPARFSAELRELEHQLGSIRAARPGTNGRSDALRP